MQTLSKYIRLLIFFTLVCTSLQGQRWRMGIYSGYSSSSFDFFGNEYIRIADSRYSGFDAEYLIDRNFGIKLGYGRQETRAAPPLVSAVKSTVIERYEFGFTARKAMSGRFDWTTGLGFGACKLSGPDYHDAIKLSSSFSAGLHYHISRFVGLQLQGRLLQFYSKAVSASAANNQSESPSTGTVVSQASVTGGLLFSIGK